MVRKIFIAGESGNNCLEMSYLKAFREEGYEVELFDTTLAIKKYARPFGYGYTLHKFFPVESWVKKANKDLTEAVKTFEPDLFIAFSGAQILPGSFAYIRSLLATRLYWYWADPLPNLSRYVYLSVPLTDGIFTYSESSVKAFRAMGMKNAWWLPFAADADAHFIKAAARHSYAYDVSFIGSWRPEREHALRVIYENFPGLRFRVAGPYWHRCTFAPIRRIASTKPVYGKEFSEIVQQSYLSLNVNDKSNYPAVNMRFFEILTAGGLELCSAGPEMEQVFRNREHLLYFSNDSQLIETVRFALENTDSMEAVKIAGQALLRKDHLYLNRVKKMVSVLDTAESVSASGFINIVK